MHRRRSSLPIRFATIVSTIIIGGLILFLVKKSNPLSIFQVNSETTQVTRKVLILNFNPIIENQGSRQLTEILNWNSPKKLTTQYIADIFETSHSYLNYQITDWLDIDDFPQLADNFDYNDDSWFACWNNHSLCHNPTQVNYNQILIKYKVCDKINAGLIDELWLWGGPWFGYYEANMAGPNAFFTNGPVILNTTCQRQTHIMGFNYERGNSEMIENFGHRTEGTMVRTFGSWTAGLQTHDWNKFTGYQKVTSKPVCGNVHYAPNSVSDYDWANLAYVDSSCEDWLNYPNQTGIKINHNCTAWNCNGYEYKKWWLHHLPHAAGINSVNGKLNSWWKYVIDYPNAAALPDPLPPPSPTPSPSPSPHSCQTDIGTVWCSNHGGIALTVNYDVYNWSECLNWCRQKMTSSLPICQYNADGPRNCWINFTPLGGIANCRWQAGTPAPYGACYPAISPSPSPSPKPTPKPLCVNQCGNGTCEEMVCLGEKCPCPENPDICPQDCKYKDCASPTGCLNNSQPIFLTQSLPSAVVKKPYLAVIQGYDNNSKNKLTLKVIPLTIRACRNQIKNNQAYLTCTIFGLFTKPGPQIIEATLTNGINAVKKTYNFSVKAK